ncbi:hypothetical protein [Streptomyces anulatus]|uniref:hypothetical protein n=1 Tax=Streptomyces anulatus TaxID=1892 RepID=UPI001C27E241|nr:hypothetical protein [Streptomyces anulatus]
MSEPTQDPETTARPTASTITDPKLDDLYRALDATRAQRDYLLLLLAARIAGDNR